MPLGLAGKMQPGKSSSGRSDGGAPAPAAGGRGGDAEALRQGMDRLAISSGACVPGPWHSTAIAF